jgi:uncharacterized protein
MIVYIDTSALVKRYVRESGTQEVVVLLQELETVGTVLLTRVELASAMAKAVRIDWMTAGDAELGWQDFLADWESLVRLPLGAGLVERAGRLAWEHGLRGYDALHLASAVLWGETLDHPVVLATFDRELWLAAARCGLEPWPEAGVVGAGSGS